MDSDEEMEPDFEDTTKEAADPAAIQQSQESIRKEGPTAEEIQQKLAEAKKKNKKRKVHPDEIAY